MLSAAISFSGTVSHGKDRGFFPENRISSRIKNRPNSAAGWHELPR